MTEWTRTDHAQDEKEQQKFEELEMKLHKAIVALRCVREFVRDVEPHAEQRYTLDPALRFACEILGEIEEYYD